eukprot:Pgem_evm1s3508
MYYLQQPTNSTSLPQPPPPPPQPPPPPPQPKSQSQSLYPFQQYEDQYIQKQRLRQQFNQYESKNALPEDFPALTPPRSTKKKTFIGEVAHGRAAEAW